MMIDVSQVKSYIEANLDSVHKTQQVAAQMNCSLDKLKRTFYRTEKLSLSKYIRESRVARMKERLQTSDIPCKVVCLDLGLREDVGARLFRNMTGMTMEEFRKMHRHEMKDTWRLDTQKQVDGKPAPQLVLTERVIKHILSTAQNKQSKQPNRRGNGILVQGPAN